MAGDNAGGGRRGLRATLTPALLEALRDCYGIDATHSAVDLGGSSSLNLLVVDHGCQSVARVYRPYVTQDRLLAINRVRRALAAQGVPCPDTLPTRDGRPWIMVGDRLVEVERYVEHNANMDTWERLEIGLPMLGRIHAILRGIEGGAGARNPLFANHIEPGDALAKTLEGTRRIRSWRPSPAELGLADAAERLARLVSSAEQELVSALPRQLVHGDFWDNNVLFCDGRIVLVSDLDFMGERARIDDLALTLYFACQQYPEDPVSDAQLAGLCRLIDAYDSGLAIPLSRLERAALAPAIARQPLWSVGGWVALLDDEQSARRHAVGMISEVEWALRLMREIDRWRSAFT